MINKKLSVKILYKVKHSSHKFLQTLREQVTSLTILFRITLKVSFNSSKNFIKYDYVYKFPNVS